MYELGYYVAFICEVSELIFMATLSRAGWRRVNYRSIGYRISLFTGEPRELTPFYQKHWYWVVPLKMLLQIAWLGIQSLLSWVAVALYIRRLMFSIGFSARLPEAAKEFEHKILSQNLGGSNMLKLMLALADEDECKYPQAVVETNRRLVTLNLPLIEGHKNPKAA